MTGIDFHTQITDRLQKQGTSNVSWLTHENIERVVNKALLDWCRRQVHGSNLKHEGIEESTMRVDDLQLFLKDKKLSFGNKDTVKVVTEELPSDYLYYNRLSVFANKGACYKKRIASDLVENSNIDDLLIDYMKKPSFDFEETFHTLKGNKFEVYHGSDFDIDSLELSYCRKPKYIYIRENDSKSSEEIELKDDLFHLIVDEAVKIIGIDISNIVPSQAAEKRIEENN